MKCYKKRRSHFLLLEVLIAFSLLVLCALPLLSAASYVLVGQTKSFHTLKGYKEGHHAFCHEIERLYKGAISYEELKTGRLRSIEGKEIPCTFLYQKGSDEKGVDLVEFDLISWIPGGYKYTVCLTRN